MHKCPQTKNQSTLEHGFSVKNYLFDLINHLENGSKLKYDWSLPDWVYENKNLIISSLPSKKTLKLYTIFHDCGKWKCLKLDDDGKSHFPNHAEESYKVFSELFSDEVAANLIRKDMDIHLLKSDKTEEFSKDPLAITLLLTGLSEIHSNSSLFGGKDSTSFKIKFKSITQRGKQIFKLLST